MSNVNAKYLRDESDDIFSPITSSDAVYTSNTMTAQNKIDSFNNKLENISAVKTFYQWLKLTTSWQNTGIAGNNFSESEEGAYLIRMLVDVGSQGFYNESFVGVCSIYARFTNDTSADEIPLTCLGHAREGHYVNLRIARLKNSGSNNDFCQLQIKADTNWSNSASFRFDFKRML